jgi:hypothetical protein
MTWASRASVLRLSGVGVAGPVHGKAWQVDDPLLPLPQQRQQEGSAAPGLVDGPDGLLGQGEDLVDEPQEVGLVIFDLPGEKFRSRSVEDMSPVELLAGIDPRPHLVHESLRLLGCQRISPVEDPADGSLCSEFSPISISGRGLHGGRGAIPFKPSDGGETQAILGPLGRHSGTVPERQTQ